MLFGIPHFYAFSQERIFGLLIVAALKVNLSSRAFLCHLKRQLANKGKACRSSNLQQSTQVSNQPRYVLHTVEELSI